MNVLDLVILAIVILAALNGFRRGASLQLASYTGLLIGLLLGALLAPRAAKLGDTPLVQAAIAMGTLLALAAIGDAVGWLVGTRIWAFARRSALGGVDSAAGSLVAIVATLLVVWFLGFNLVNGPFPPLSREIRRSTIIQAMDAALPRPPSLLAQVRQFLNRFGFPEVFADLPPAPAGPVDAPSGRQIRGAVQRAAPSTVKIVGRACNAVQEGSGFVAAPGHVITNAHVVAGVDEPVVQVQNGPSFDAVTVLFDPDLDVAVLRIDGDAGEPLPLDTETKDRGTPGAVLGYPGGGSLDVQVAAVRRDMDALGRDIYGNSTVDRHVYELQTEVRPGNSGGPFIDTEGEVAGVVFAASVADPDVGYALTAEEVAPRLQRGMNRASGVSTGPCIR